MMQAVSTIIIVMGAVALMSAYPSRNATSPESSPKIAAQVQCSPLDRMCLSRGQIPHADGQCYTPLERGPCPKNQIIVIDVNGGLELRASCRAQQCPSGLMPFTNGRCLEFKTARVLLCSGSDIHLDATGYPRCGRFSGWVQGIHEIVRCTEAKKKREISDIDEAGSIEVRAVRTSDIICVENNSGDCVSGTIGDSPNPVIETEK
ncbi:hypothetical protein R5R35_011786 [Gryllus longicercus]|uniref:Accessory gland protein n=1 Tax=Gryllus longicercus TaxID=2509291 RepID=A0AAN9W085_9ORTH